MFPVGWPVRLMHWLSFDHVDEIVLQINNMEHEI